MVASKCADSFFMNEYIFPQNRVLSKLIGWFIITFVLHV